MPGRKKSKRDPDPDVRTIYTKTRTFKYRPARKFPRFSNCGNYHGIGQGNSTVPESDSDSRPQSRGVQEEPTAHRNSNGVTVTPSTSSSDMTTPSTSSNGFMNGTAGQKVEVKRKQVARKSAKIYPKKARATKRRKKEIPPSSIVTRSKSKSDEKAKQTKQIDDKNKKK